MKLSDKVVEVLQGARCEGYRLTLPERLDRTVYGHVNRALEAAGGRWSRRDAAFIFSRPSAAVVANLIADGAVCDARADHGAFYTPPALAARVIAAALIRRGDEVLEPSAGGGALAAPAAAAGGLVCCIELRPEACAALRGRGLSVAEGDFLRATPASLGLFDRVVMNPPFGRRQDVDHVLHAARFLRPGGRLVAVVPAGVESRADHNTVQLRELVAQQGGAITRLPAGSFRSAGTEIHAALVVFDLQRLVLPSSSSAAA